MALTTRYTAAMFAVAAFVAFVVITYGVTHGAKLTEFDVRDFAERQRTVTSSGERANVIVSLAGLPASMTILAVLGALWLGWNRRMLPFVFWLCAFAGASLLVVVLKRTMHRTRPFGADVFRHGTSASFPSGHTVGSVVGFGMLTYLLSSFWVNSHRSRIRLALIAVRLVGLNAHRRLYLGEHFLSDVIAGLALGAVWLSIYVQATEFAYRYRARQHA